jgi:para-nitrobenzyl esterase
MKHQILLSFFTVAITSAWADFPQVVKLDSGPISGTAGQSAEVRVFKGIPYAAPPVGELRWRPPQPVKPWELHSFRGSWQRRHPGTLPLKVER